LSLAQSKVVFKTLSSEFYDIGKHQAKHHGGGAQDWEKLKKLFAEAMQSYVGNGGIEQKFVGGSPTSQTIVCSARRESSAVYPYFFRSHVTQQGLDPVSESAELWQVASVTAGIQHLYATPVIKGASFIDNGLGIKNPTAQVIEDIVNAKTPSVEKPSKGHLQIFDAIVNLGSGKINVDFTRGTAITTGSRGSRTSQIWSYVTSLMERLPHPSIKYPKSLDDKAVHAFYILRDSGILPFYRLALGESCGRTFPANVKSIRAKHKGLTLEYIQEVTELYVMQDQVKKTLWEVAHKLRRQRSTDEGPDYSLSVASRLPEDLRQREEHISPSSHDTQRPAPQSTGSATVVEAPTSSARYDLMKQLLFQSSGVGKLCLDIILVNALSKDRGHFIIGDPSSRCDSCQLYHSIQELTSPPRPTSLIVMRAMNTSESLEVPATTADQGNNNIGKPRSSHQQIDGPVRPSQEPNPVKSLFRHSAEFLRSHVHVPSRSHSQSISATWTPRDRPNEWTVVFYKVLREEGWEKRLKREIDPDRHHWQNVALLPSLRYFTKVPIVVEGKWTGVPMPLCCLNELGKLPLEAQIQRHLKRRLYIYITIHQADMTQAFLNGERYH